MMVPVNKHEIDFLFAAFIIICYSYSYYCIDIFMICFKVGVLCLCINLQMLSDCRSLLFFVGGCSYVLLVLLLLHCCYYFIIFIVDVVTAVVD
jgi:hypothetical protein